MKRGDQSDVCKSADGDYLFVWRVEDIEDDDGLFDLSDLSLSSQRLACPFCNGRTEQNEQPYAIRFLGRDFIHCFLCGWYTCSSYRHARHVNSTWTGSGLEFVQIVYDEAEHLRSTLRCFELSSDEVALDELGSHIRRLPEVLNHLWWRRFEQLVADVFKNYGNNVILTKASCDNGADLILLDGAGKVPHAIVECKRFRSDRKVQVDLVRKLAGAAIDWDVRKAYLVTSSDFSQGARNAASRFRSRGYEFDLVAAADLLQLLQVYNAKLPRLDALSNSDREALVESNCSRIRYH